MTDTLVKEIRGNVMVLTINRPEARNAMDFETATAIAAALDELDARDDLSIAVLTGAGNTFCSGMDLKGFLAGKRPSIPGRGFGGADDHHAPCAGRQRRALRPAVDVRSGRHGKRHDHRARLTPAAIPYEQEKQA